MLTLKPNIHTDLLTVFYLYFFIQIHRQKFVNNIKSVCVLGFTIKNMSNKFFFVCSVTYAALIRFRK